MGHLFLLPIPLILLTVVNILAGTSKLPLVGQWDGLRWFAPLIALAPAVTVLLANAIFDVENILDFVLVALAAGVLAEAVYVAVLIFPAWRLGPVGKTIFVVANVLFMLFACSVFFEAQNPVDGGGWTIFGLAILIPAPAVVAAVYVPMLLVRRSKLALAPPTDEHDIQRNPAQP